MVAYVGLYSPVFASVKVPANTSIHITPVDTVTSKNKDLDTITCEIVDDVVINGVKVFAAGGKAELHIGEMDKARCWGKPGKMLISNGYAYDVKGTKHKILVSKNIYGDEKTWPKVMGGISIFFLWPLALFGFVHGGQATVSATSQIQTDLASEFSF